MDAAFLIFLTAGIAAIAYALSALAYEFTLVFMEREGGSLSRYTQPHIFWRAAFIGFLLVAFSLALKVFQILM